VAPTAAQSELGQGIVSPRVKGMTLDQADECHAPSLQNAVFLNGKTGIGGACRVKPAGGEKKGR